MSDRDRASDIPKLDDDPSAYCDELLSSLVQAHGDEAVNNEAAPNLQLGLCAHLAESRNPLELHHQILGIVQGMGFSDYCFVRMAAADKDNPLITNPREQLLAYFQEDFIEHDFMVKYVAQNTRPIFLSKVYSIAYDAPYDIDVFRANQKIYELNQKFGFLDYYCIPMKSCRSGTNVLLTISQRGASPTSFQVNIARHKPTLHVLCEAIDYVTNSKFPTEFLDESINDDVEINPKPLLVLNTLANNDMTIAAVAEKLNISAITANQHMAAVRRELGVRTTVGAIKKAIKLGLIHYTD